MVLADTLGADETQKALIAQVALAVTSGVQIESHRWEGRYANMIAACFRDAGLPFGTVFYEVNPETGFSHLIAGPEVELPAYLKVTVTAESVGAGGCCWGHV